MGATPHLLTRGPETPFWTKQSSARPDLDTARDQLDQATTLFGDMEMTWWSDQAEALRGRIEAGEPFRGFAPYHASADERR